MRLLLQRGSPAMPEQKKRERGVKQGKDNKNKSIYWLNQSNIYYHRKQKDNMPRREAAEIPNDHVITNVSLEIIVHAIFSININ